ncbi:MAG: hemerythrin domain-containing protein [Streptosporangiaceae bacterium]
MRTVQEVPGRGVARAAVSAADGPPLTLAEEHALLREQVAVRARDVLTAIAGGRRPARELRALVGYLRAEVLRQAADQEWLFPAHQAGEDFGRLARDHVRLREGTEALAQAAPEEGTSSLAQLATATRDILAQLERHLAAEERLLTAAGRPGTAPGVTAAGRRHEWYPLTEGPVVDLDVLPSGQVVGAAVDRLLRLRPGEQVELRSGRDPWPVWQGMDDLCPGRYGFVYLQEGPEHWRLQVTRRPPA